MHSNTDFNLPMDFSVIDLPLDILRQRLLELFCDVAYQEGDFVMSSGKRSHYYVNGKQVTLHPHGAIMIGRLLLDRLPSEIQVVAGLTLGADPMVSAVSAVGMYENRVIVPLIVRKAAKGHGTQAYIEGLSCPSGTSVVVLEDVVTTGQSAFKAVERLQQAGYQVSHILALVDRQQGGRELYRDRGLSFDAIFTLAEIQAHWRNQ